MMFNLSKKEANVDEIKYEKWRELILAIDNSLDDGWENIANEFNFDFHQINLIKQKSKMPDFSPANAVLSSLRHNLVPIKKLYKCLVDYQLIQACNILEKEYPNDTIISEEDKLARENQIIPTLQPLSTSTKQFENDQNRDSQLIKFLPIEDTTFNLDDQNEPPLSLKNLIDYENILPVIYYNKEKSDPILNNYQTHVSFDNNLPVQFKMNGTFEIIHIDKRKLSFRKKEFTRASDYLKELKMIKHRHFNLYTAECILKNTFDPKMYGLLYSVDKNEPSKLLPAYAEEILNSHLNNQYILKNQLQIMLGVASGLDYLHEKDKFKNQIIHGNLQGESVLIFFNNNNSDCSAKLVDFTSTVEINGSQNNESKILEEFNRFGLLIYFILTWTNMDIIESYKIHNNAQNYEDRELYKWELYESSNLKKKQPQSIINTLWQMFFALTSPTYNYDKGIKKSYDRLNQLMDKYMDQYFRKSFR